MSARVLVHASAVVLGAACAPFGGAVEGAVLLMGASGAGKSDVALRLIDGAGCGIGTELLTAKLVSDDQTMVMRRGDRLIGSAPEAIAGKLEIRGLGIVELQYQAESELSLAVTLTPEGGRVAQPQPQSGVAGRPSRANSPVSWSRKLVMLRIRPPSTKQRAT